MYGVQTGYGSGAVIPPVKRSSTIDRQHTRAHASTREQLAVAALRWGPHGA